MTRLLLDPQCARCDLRELTRQQQRAELGASQSSLPALMRLQFVFPFPLEVRLIVEASREKPQEFPATSGGASIISDKPGICEDEIVTYTATPVNGGTNPVYAWFVNGIEAKGETKPIFIYSPEKNTLILFPYYSWNVANNFDIDFILQSFFQEELESYENLVNAFFIRGRWSF